MVTQLALLDVDDVQAMALEPGETFLLHRYPFLPHDEGAHCWCSPIEWTYDQITNWPPKAIQDRLDKFFCVH
jgi:hypothetical protein